MIRILEHHIYRGDVKIGWIDGNDVMDMDEHKLGYFTGNDIFNKRGIRIGYIDGSYLKTAGAEFHKISMEDVRKHVSGGTISDVARGAIRLLIGD